MPAPGRIWESTIQSRNTLDSAGAPLSIQGKVFPNPQFVGSTGDYNDMFYAFYAPDMLADPKLAASTRIVTGKHFTLYR